MRHWILSIALLAGCSFTTKKWADNFSSIRSGMSEVKVVEKLGEPDSIKGGLWTYYLRHKKYEGFFTSPYYIFFDQGRVLRWGRNEDAYEQARQLHLESLKSP